MVFLRWTRHLASSLALLFLVGALSCASLQPHSEQSQPEDKQATAKELSAPADAKNTTDRQEQPHNLWPQLQERLVDPVTWFTLGLLILAHRQWKVMAFQADSMKDTLAETKRSADAAKTSAEVAQRTMELASRPWLDIKDWNVGHTTLQKATPTSLPHAVGVDFVIANPSDVPARVLSIHIDGKDGAPHALPELLPQYLPPRGNWHPPGLTMGVFSDDEIGLMTMSPPTFKPLMVKATVTYTDRLGRNTYTRTGTRGFLMTANGFKMVTQFSSDDDTLDDK